MKYRDNMSAQELVNTIKVGTEKPKDVRLPYYINSIETDVSKTGRSVKIRVFGQAHPDDKNPPMDSPWVYLPLDFFGGCLSAQQMANLVLHRMRYYTLKIEGKYDFNELVRQCRPLRGTHKEVLSSLGKEWAEKYPNYRENSLLVQKLRQELTKRIGVVIEEQQEL